MKTNPIRSLSSSLILAAAVLLAGISQGQLVNVNFHNVDGGPQPEGALDGPLGGLGTTWNQSSDTSGTDASASDGTATTIDWSIDTNIAENDTESWPTPARVMQIGSFANFGKGEDSTFTISGLDPGEYYNVAIASTRLRTQGTEHSHGIFSTSNFTTSVSSQLANGLTSISGDEWILGVNYVLFQKVQPNLNGEISFLADATDEDELYAGSPAYRLHVNGFQIEKTTAPVFGAVDDASSTVEASPAIVFADGATTSTVTVTLRDFDGNGVPGKEVTLANTSGPQAATINPLTPVTTNGAGQAFFTVSSSIPGIEEFTATDVSDSLTLTATTTVEFEEVGLLTNTAQSTVVASPFARLADGASASTITVTLRDANGFPVSGKNVTLANSGGNQAATISPLGAVVSDANGEAVFSVTSSTVGTEEFTATDATDSVVVSQIAIVSFIDPSAPKLINVNFTGDESPPPAEGDLVGPAGGLFTNWNQINSTSSGLLMDSTGTMTTASINLADLDFTALDTDQIDLKILRGSFTNFGKGIDDTVVTLNGLVPGNYYNVWLVTLRNQAFGDDGTEQYVGWWSTTNETTSPNSQLVNAVDETINTSTFVAGYNYVLFQQVKADLSGNIVFTGVAGPLADGSNDNHRLGLNAVQIEETDAPSLASYATWSSGAPADGDANNDGVQNAVAWVLGAANPNENAVALIPTLDNTSDPDFLIFNYRRSDDANSDPKTAIKVEYSSNLANWSDALAGPDIIITPFNDDYAAGIDRVEVKIRRTLAVGGKLFARLNVVVTP